MTEQKPKCTDFVVAAIRKLRTKRKSTRSGTAVGIDLRKVWRVAATIYSENEFRGALTELMDTEVVLFSVSLTIYDSGALSDSRDTEILRSIPDKVNLDKSYWWVSSNGTVSYRLPEDFSGTHYGSMLLYVIEDGLPKKFDLMPRDRDIQIAKEIIAELADQKKLS